MSTDLKVGDRAEIRDYAVRVVRPLGTTSGEIVADRGDCWAIRFDGTKAPRAIWKAYLQRERVAA